MNRYQRWIAIGGFVVFALALHVSFCEWRGNAYAFPGLPPIQESLGLYADLVSPAWAVTWGILTPLALLLAALFLWAGLIRSTERIEMDSELVERYIADTSSEILGIRRDALKKLASGGPAVPSALPVLLGLVDEKDLEIRILAIKGLAGYGERVANTVPRLGAMLRESKHFQLRLQILRTLSALGPHAREALEAVEELKDHKDPRMRCWALQAIEDIREG